MTAPDGPLGGARVRFGPEIFRIQAHGGVSRYVIEVHQGLLERGVDSEIEAAWHISELLAGVPRVRGRHVPALAGPAPGRLLTREIDEVVARRAAARLGPGDVWHPSYFPKRLPPPPADGGPRLAITVYDMIHERFPETVFARDHAAARKAAACVVADVILCISQDTADDLQERLGVPGERITVTHLGVAPVVPVVRPAPFGDQPYLVYIGDRRSPYKNWLALLDALQGVPEEVGLLCIGAPEGEGDRAALASRSLGDRVRFEGGTDGEVAGRLARSAGLVYPSRYEGFGLPPLEALAQGCPVVASDVGAIPEVVGGIAILVEPTVDGIGAGIEALLAGGPEVDRQRTDGPAHAAGFTWQDTTARTIEAYQGILA